MIGESASFRRSNLEHAQLGLFEIYPALFRLEARRMVGRDGPRGALPIFDKDLEG